MSVSLVNPEVTSESAVLLSEITGQEIDPDQLTPVILFLGSLVTILSGVIAIDQTVDQAEKQLLHTIVDSLVDPDSELYPLMQQAIAGVEEQQIYLDPQKWMVLTSSFALPEQLMLIGLGYEMAAADGTIDFREKMYLQAIAQRLDVPLEYLNVLEYGFMHQNMPEQTALCEVQALLDPERFASCDEIFADIARSILAALPAET